MLSEAPPARCRRVHRHRHVAVGPGIPAPPGAGRQTVGVSFPPPVVPPLRIAVNLSGRQFVRQDLLGYGFTKVDQVYDPYGTRTQIKNGLEEGRRLIHYCGHGSTTSWSNPSMTQSDIAGMTNDGKYFLAIGNCCLTSTYDSGECFGETFIRAANKGAIGYIGGSNSTYWDEDVYWSVGYTTSISAIMRFDDTEYGAYDGLWHTHGEAEQHRGAAPLESVGPVPPAPRTLFGRLNAGRRQPPRLRSRDS